MRLRVRQLACLLFLLASITATAGDSARPSAVAFAPRYVAVLQELHARNLRLIAAAQPEETASHVRPASLAASQQAALAQPWTMQPPAQHTTSVTAHTALAV